MTWRTFLAAPRKYSGPFCMVILPRNRTSLSSLSMGAGGDPNICYYHSYWALGPEEALVIEVTPPECTSWNFQLDNHWMESLDYRYHRVDVNHFGAEREPNGGVRLIVAHEDPGHPNWLDTAGHACGTMCLRWIGADAHPQPATRVVPFAKLRSR